MQQPKVILDSGAFTAYKKGKKINIDEYAQFVKEHGHEFAGCFTLDEIGNGEKSYQNWIYLRKLGVDTIPVYHIGTDEIWLHKYLKQTDYIGLGAIANLDSSQRTYGLDHIWNSYLLNPSKVSIIKVHGLGLTAIPIMLRYPWYSVDSFTPVISAVWGSVLLPLYKADGMPDYENTFICKISDQGVHRKGMDNSYTNLPKRCQAQYQKLFKENGVSLGDIAYQKIHPRRGGKLAPGQSTSGLFNLTHTSNDTEKTLANNWGIRMYWNLLIWRKLKDSLLSIYDRNLLMYMGVSTTTHLQIFESLKPPKLDILISYAYMSPDIFTKIKNYCNGTTT